MAMLEIADELLEALGLDYRHQGAKQARMLIERIWKIKKSRKRIAKDENPIWGYENLKII